MLDFNEILGFLSEKTGKSREELLEMTEERRKKYAGLLTEQGAVVLLAKELNVPLDISENASETLKVNDMRQGLKNVDLLVSVKKVFNEKSFEKNGKKGKVASLIVFDETGDIRLSLWNRETELIEKLKIERGNKLKASNCIVSEYNGKQQLSLGYNGSINVVENSIMQPKKISELKEEMQDIDVSGYIARKFRPNYFDFQGEKRKVLGFELQDDTGKVICKAWNDLVEKIEETDTGTLVKIEGAYTKKGLNALELHLGWNSRIIGDYWIQMEKPRELEKNYKRYSLKELSKIDAENNAEAKATIVSLNRNELHYKACIKCGKKAKQVEGRIVCDKCGEIESTAIIPFINILVDDGTASMQAVAFREAAGKLHVREEELEEYIENGKINDYIELVKGRILGKTMIFQGKTKRNAFSNEIEFVIDEVKEVSMEKEAESLLKR